MYVGGSIDIERRFREHKIGKDANNHAIDRAILKYGKENFIYQIITELPTDWGVIGKHEKYWVNFYNTFKNKHHYNLKDGGNGMGQYNYSEESRKKMSESHIGITHSEETKRKISEAQKGKKNNNWKNYSRIIKAGFNGGKQRYALIFNGTILKKSIFIDKLIKWFNENYPDEELVIDEGIKLE